MGKVGTEPNSTLLADGCKQCFRPKTDVSADGAFDAAASDGNSSVYCPGGSVRLVREGFWVDPAAALATGGAPPFVYRCENPSDCSGLTPEQEEALDDFLQFNSWETVRDALATATAAPQQAGAAGRERRMAAAAAAVEVAVNTTDDGRRVMTATVVATNATIEITLNGCAPGQTGPKCAVCLRDWARSGASPGTDGATSCIECPEEDPSASRLFMRLSFFAFVLLIVLRGIAAGDGGNAFDDVEEDDGADEAGKAMGESRVARAL